MNWPETLSAAATLFLVMDPLGNVPIFNSILSNMDPRRRARVVARELVFALVILLGFLLAGTAVMKFLGLSQSSLSIAGGLLLFIISLRMIFPAKAGEPGDPDEAEDPFIVPLAVPLVAGPSTIALLMLHSSSRPELLHEWIVALLMAWAASTVLLVGSPKVMALIGHRGSRALERLMGMILVILSTQMLLNGIRGFVLSLGAGA
ncbi:YhgN family NAAT transporter [Marinihelvus fidelis]|uniref:UPF0056 membrane protein n=1 Tax=Marinihelvus fidelis TaxID=2613842 RepID=A0A5N0TBM2_9GAMM|nr:YhgN family NAAT transporter [Marinihelvus fidelis]KAA9131824.1 YhgN family NAAT transporter [Marinihelvus fidelis]